MRLAPLLIPTLVLCAVTIARADIPPPPGATERYLRNTIEKAGQTCDEVRSYASGTDGASDSYEPGRGLEPYTVNCVNGKAYLVAVPRKHIGPWPDAPQPVVKEIGQR